MSGHANGSGSSSFYPVFLRLAGRRVLLVGGGPVAASKLQGLLDAGAAITVVSPEIVAEIGARARANAATVEIHQREFAAADLEGVWFVVAAATPDVNRAVARAADERQIFVNAVDDPPNATAYLGGVVRREGVTVAISTDGHAPALAGLLREALDSLLPAPAALSKWMQEARAIRQEWIANGVPMEARRPLLLQRLNELYAEQER
jgi:uroporphyrin-III C-methyltransferase/precorrin-2 dehydrogenase/sirohydrochlorin ferrochelatase